MQKAKYSIIAVIVVLLLAIGALEYHQLENDKKLLNKIEALELSLEDKIKAESEINLIRQKELNATLVDTEKRLSNSLENVAEDLNSFKTGNEDEINALNSIINEIERQSAIDLELVKNELNRVKVQNKDFSQVVEKALPSIVSVRTNVGQGSGVAIVKGYILTNLHVVDKSNLINILTYDRDIFSAQVVWKNSTLDLAILQTEAEIAPMKFADSADVRVGERVIALGNPAGLSFTVTEGIVSAVKRTGPNGLNIYLQTDVPINPGNSGGPLVNADGKIVGINNFKAGGFEGLGFALESNAAKNTVNIVENLNN